MSLTSVNECHNSGMIHNARYDYYGTRLALATSEGKVLIYEKKDNSFPQISEQKRHEGSAWELSWSNPKFGVYLASVGFDKKVIIYKECSKNTWKEKYSYKHTSSVNTCKFSPSEYGLILLCGSSDGQVSLHEFKDNIWLHQSFEAHASGILSVSWGPSFYPVSFQNEMTDLKYNCEHGFFASTSSDDIDYPPLKFGKQEGCCFSHKEEGDTKCGPPMRFVTGGADNIIKVWTCNTNHQSQKEKKEEEKISFNSNNNNQATLLNDSTEMKVGISDHKFSYVDLKGHKNWVRCVSWFKYPGKPYELIVSCSEDETVKIWKNEGDEWKKYDINYNFGFPTWKAEFSRCGSQLAISAGNNLIYLFKETDDLWELNMVLGQSENEQIGEH